VKQRRKNSLIVIDSVRGRVAARGIFVARMSEATSGNGRASWKTPDIATLIRATAVGR
jgi:hypothetical protein